MRLLNQFAEDRLHWNIGRMTIDSGKLSAWKKKCTPVFRCSQQIAADYSHAFVSVKLTALNKTGVSDRVVI
jgi:hypothetical protein